MVSDLWQAIVNDEADVGFVDAHSKGDGGDNNVDLIPTPATLHFTSLRAAADNRTSQSQRQRGRCAERETGWGGSIRRHRRMIVVDEQPSALQVFGHSFTVLLRRTVNDATFIALFGFDVLNDVLHSTGSFTTKQGESGSRGILE